MLHVYINNGKDTFEKVGPFKNQREADACARVLLDLRHGRGAWKYNRITGQYDWSGAYSQYVAAYTGRQKEMQAMKKTILYVLKRVLIGILAMLLFVPMFYCGFCCLEVLLQSSVVVTWLTMLWAFVVAGLALVGVEIILDESQS